jgi:hypothetical protein
MGAPEVTELIRRHCLREDLSTPDPYDRWCTAVGRRLKAFYFGHRWAGLGPVAVWSLVDMCLDGLLPAGRREYPVVRAVAAQSLLNLYEQEPDGALLAAARRHLDWLLEHACAGWSGPCWGLGFPNVISSTLQYDASVPYSTMTPYALEAFVRYTDVTGSSSYAPAIRGIFRFFARDLKVMDGGDGRWMATSYTPLRDRVVVNASSYNMYAHALCLEFVGSAERAAAMDRLVRLYRFVKRSQRADGSWLYAPGGRPFIDCFHSCIVLKNIVKTARIVELEGARETVEAGYRFLLERLYDAGTGLFRRFALANKPGLVRFDLYDNAEMLNLALLLGDLERAARLRGAIFRHFYRAPDLYSQIDRFGVRRRKNTLRWAVMPLLYALSCEREAEQRAGLRSAAGGAGAARKERGQAACAE